MGWADQPGGYTDRRAELLVVVTFQNPATKWQKKHWLQPRGTQGAVRPWAGERLQVNWIMRGVQTSARLRGRWDCGRDQGGRWKWKDISGDFRIKIKMQPPTAHIYSYSPSCRGDIMPAVQWQPLVC